MDSRRELEVYLAQKRIPNAVIKSLLDNFAHDLAEAIRGMSLYDGYDETTRDAAANLIDPEVEA